jgi:hypothetical protein
MVGSKFMKKEEASQNPLAGYYLIRGYAKDQDCLSSLMDLPPDEAVAAMKKIHPTRGIGPADQDGNRPQKKYYADRKTTDDWLRENAGGTAGVAMERKNPTFFALTKDPDGLVKKMSAAGHDLLVVAAQDADLSRWSFTFDDSMGSFLSTRGQSVFLPDKHPMHGKVLNAQQLAAAIETYGTAQSDGGTRNIEAQYWSKEPLKGAVVPGAPKPQAPPAAPRRKNDGPKL